MGIPGGPNPLLMRRAAAAADDAYQIENSLRFNEADSPTFKRTASSGGNRRTWTWSGWVKRSDVATSGHAYLFASWLDGNNASRCMWATADQKLQFYQKIGGTVAADFKTYAIHRDASAWMHVVVAYDSTNATESDRVKIYVNGERQGLTQTTAIPLNQESWINKSGEVHWNGSLQDGTQKSLKGYLADVQFIDGLALHPSSFGEFDSARNWNPAEFKLLGRNNGSTWSGQVAGTEDSGWEKTQAFNGNTGNSARADTGYTLTFTPTTKMERVASLRIFADHRYGSKAASTLLVNGTNYSHLVPKTSGAWVDIPENNLETIAWSSVEAASSGDAIDIGAIEVDGEILVDGEQGYPNGADRNNPNVGGDWATKVTFNSGTWNANSGALSFDGSPATSNYATVTKASGGWATFSLADFAGDNKTITVTAEQTILTLTHAGGTSSFTPSNTSNVTHTFPSVTLNSSSNIKLEGLNNDSVWVLCAIKVNGHTLINSSVDNSFHLKFNDTSSNARLGWDSLNEGTILEPVKTGQAVSGYWNDPNKANLVLALPGTDLKDYHATIKGSGSNKTETTSGTSLSTSTFKLYGSSIHYDNSADTLSFPDHDDWDIGSGDYCVEAWVYIDTHQSDRMIVAAYTNSGSTAWQLYYGGGSSNNRFAWFIINSGFGAGNNYVESTSLSTDYVDKWVHIAGTVNGTTDKIAIYVNGVKETEASYSGTVQSYGDVLGIGYRTGTTSHTHAGMLNDVRVYKGTTKYSSNFTPPTRQDFAVTNLTAEVGTSWGGSKTVTAVNGATTTTSNTKFYGTSKQFDGSNDYASTQASNDWKFGTGDYTAEAWVRMHSHHDAYAVSNSVGGSWWGINFWATNGSNGSIRAGYNSKHEKAHAWSTNTWYHVAVVRISGTSKLYLDGTEIDSQSDTDNLTSDSQMIIGMDPKGWGLEFDGEISDIRIYNGIGKYTGAFTVPNSSTSVASATGGLPIRDTSGTDGGTALSGFRADVIPGTSTDVTPYLVFASPGNTYSDVSGSIRAASPENLDVLTDSPTNYGTDTGAGGEVRGNYATLNPLIGTTTGYKQGNISIDGGVGSQTYRTTLQIAENDTNKYYWEITATDANNDFVGVGYSGDVDSYQKMWAWQTAGTTYRPGWATSALGFGSWADGDVLGFVLDRANNSLKCYKNNALQGDTDDQDLIKGDGVHADHRSFVGKGYIYPLWRTNTGSVKYDFNFGQRAFKYNRGVTESCKTLCTQNLDDTFSGAAVNDPSKFFAINTYAGLGTGNAQAISGMKFGPDLIWTKARSYGDSHSLSDQVRGVTKSLSADTDGVETTTAGSFVTAFNSDGYTLGNSALVNGSSTTYVSWCWDAGTAGQANTNGSINVASPDQWVNDAAGFSMTRYEGTEAAATVGHGLSAAPEFVVVKNLETASAPWVVWHKAIAATEHLYLDTDSMAVSGQTNTWNSAVPTSSVFSMNASWWSNDNGVDHIAYCWRPIEGYSIFTSYVGNASDDGPFVHCGFRPRWVLVKNVSAAGAGNSGTNWVIRDTARDDDNPVKKYLMADGSNGGYTFEGSNGNRFIDVLANGFKVRSGVGSGDHAYTPNINGETFIVAAFAEFPFKTARAR